MISSLIIDDFFELRKALPVIDVRSPGEYKKSSIPGAYNIPLFTDQERATVGKTYKQKGKHEAIKLGLRFVGPKMLEKLEAAEQIAGEAKQVIVHCWRGGMRSENMAWLFSRADIDCYVLQGGYKAYRNVAQTYFNYPWQLFILGGMTGSGKTEMLNHLAGAGEQVIDLEGLAHHKGSAFGTIGEDPQPATEFFENQLFEKLLQLDSTRPVWLEDESRTIGKVHIPEAFYARMRNSLVYKVELNKHCRVQRLISEYAKAPPHQLKQAIQAIRKRLGGVKTQLALDSVDSGDYYNAADITLTYYDKAYNYGLRKRDPELILPVRFAKDNPRENALKVVSLAYKNTF